MECTSKDVTIQQPDTPLKVEFVEDKALDKLNERYLNKVLKQRDKVLLRTTFNQGDNK
jgi:hypothetical protein